MTKLEVLELLRELVRDAVIYESQPGDESGLSTKYYVDQEQLMVNLEHQIAELQD